MRSANLPADGAIRVGQPVDHTCHHAIVLGGSLGDGIRHRARLIVRSCTQRHVRDRLSPYPWAELGLLAIESIEEWEVLLSNEPDD